MWVNFRRTRLARRAKRRLRILRSFTSNKGALAFYAPRITGQRAIIANHTMTGNGDSEFIRGASSRYRADGLRRANTPRDVSVGHRCAGRHFAKRLPNALLEGRASDIKGKVEAHPRLLDEPNHARNQVLVVAVSADKVSLREAVLEVTDEFVWIISKKDGGNALLGRRDQDGPKIGLADREFDLFVCTTRAVLRRGHAEHIG